LSQQVPSGHSLSPDALFLTRLSLRWGQPLNQSGSPRRRDGPMSFSTSLMLRRSRLHSYRPLVEVLEDRNLLSFITAPTYAVGSSPESVAVGDFNGDGIPDLAAANLGDDTVSVLLG